MDSITHIAMGAVVGKAFAGRSPGKKAMLLGAAFQSIPDIDFVASFFLEPTENILAHRGFTHSILFGVIITFILAFIAHRQKWGPQTFQHWLLFIGVELAIHLLLDACNAYGVGWFEPFSQARISFNLLFVADPAYSLPLGVAALILWLRPDNKHAGGWIKFGLIASTCYLLLSIANKMSVNQTVERNLETQQLAYNRYFTAPTAFNNLLWYCVAERDSGYYVGYRSVFDTPEQMEFTYFPRQRWLLNDLEEDAELANLLRFSKGYYTVENRGDVLVFNDLRFGLVAGWERRETEFAFHYYLQSPGKNLLVVQRGRLAEWDYQTMKSMVHRICGE